MSGCLQQEGGACEKSDADLVQATGCSQHLTLTHFFLGSVDEFRAPTPDNQRAVGRRDSNRGLSCRGCAEATTGKALYTSLGRVGPRAVATKRDYRRGGSQRREPRTSPESNHSVSCDLLLGTATAKWRLGDLLRFRFMTIAPSWIVRSSTRRRLRPISRSPPPRAHEKTRRAFSARTAARTTRCAGARRTACLAAAAFPAGAPSISSPTRPWRGCATRTAGSPSQGHCWNGKASARARLRAE